MSIVSKIKFLDLFYCFAMSEVTAEELNKYSKLNLHKLQVQILETDIKYLCILKSLASYAKTITVAKTKCHGK